MNKVRVCVLDSGLDPKSAVGREINFAGGDEFFLDESGEIKHESNAVDDIGHGTAVISVIHRLCNDIEIIPIKIVRDGTANSTEIMISALEYIYNQQLCDVINISAGIISCDNLTGLYSICQKLKDKGIIIVAAFDSEGAVSYPAAFDCVIGVDGLRLDRNRVGYCICGTGSSNYIQSMKEQRLPWIDGQTKTVSGTSFLAPEFTARVVKLIQSNGVLSFENIIARLNEDAREMIKESKYSPRRLDMPIQKAAIFPFNKEMHSLARFEDLLGFDVYGFYDTKFSGQVGRTVSELQQISCPKHDFIVQNIDKLDWNADFDTIILGHTSLLSKATRRNFEEEIISKCQKYGKKLFSCRDIRDKKPTIDYYSPHIDPIDMDGITRMHVLGCPVLGVVGTGSKQGKFSLQLSLRRELIHQGYCVGQLGTEPTAELFGMDATYPMGHESAVSVKGFDAVFAINQIMGQIEEKNPDIIIFGSQAHTVTFVPGGPSYYPVCQHELLMGCQADAYILVVCIDNPLTYIRRNITFLESLFNSKVIAIAVSPLTNNDRWSTLNNQLELLSYESQISYCKELQNATGIPVFPFQTETDIKSITNVCLSYFS
ncbi:MAG: S8 family serine peptidase [Clostridiales bacterium]|nr:S8 family serine peptidase [Clostridiales bacterium]